MIHPQVIDGFSDLVAKLENISKKALSDELKQKALEAGAEPIVSRAKRIAAQHKRTGTLEKSIETAYDSKNSKLDIGWGGDLSTTKSATGVYGRFLDNGFTHTSGKHVKLLHLKSNYEAEKENTLNNMLEVYKKELGGL